MSKTHTIITIGRQFGSGGREIGKRLADELGIEFYDKELLSRAAKDSKICKELFETHDEKPTNSFLYSLVMDTYSMGFASGSVNEMPLNHKIFLAQFDAIKKIVSDDNLFNYQAKVIRQLAEEESCVIIGRCADYALEERDDVLSVFIHADLEDRIKNVAKLNELTDNKAKDLIHKTDKRRASYYNYYTNKKWGDAESYDICINSSKFGVDGCVKAIKDFLELKASLEE